MSKAFPLSGFHILTGGSYFTTPNVIVEGWLSTRFDFHLLEYKWWVLACGCISYRSCWKKFHILKGLWTSCILEIHGPSLVFVAGFMESVICNPVWASVEDNGLVGTMLNQLRTGKDTSDFIFLISAKQFKLLGCSICKCSAEVDYAYSNLCRMPGILSFWRNIIISFFHSAKILQGIYHTVSRLMRLMPDVP